MSKKEPQSIEESIEQDEALLKQEAEASEPEKEVEVEAVEPEQKQEKTEAVEKKEDEAQEPEVKEPEVKDNSYFARKRAEAKKEKKDAEEQLRRLREENERLKAQHQPKKEAEEEIDPVQREIKELRQQNQQLMQGMQGVLMKESYNDAESHLRLIENDFKKTTPDYDQAINLMMERDKRGMKAFNSNISDFELNARAKTLMMDRAAYFYKQNLNPAEALYALSQEYYGYQPPVQETSKEKVVRNLETVEKNKKKTQSLMTKGRTGEHKISAERIATASLSEFEGYGDEDIKAALEYGD